MSKPSSHEYPPRSAAEVDPRGVEPGTGGEGRLTENALDLVPRGSQDMVAAAIRSIFEQPDEPSASAQLRRVADGLAARFPAVADLLLEAEADLLVHFTFPEAHRRQIRSTNPLAE